MNIHEYQAKGLLAAFGIPVPEGRVAASPGEAREAAAALGGPVWIVKAQIHAGGRGKAGGIRVCRSPDEVGAAARDLLGKVLITNQTGPEGRPVHKVYIERGADIEREFYAGLLVDRDKECIVFVLGAVGGVEIEQVASREPEKILVVPLALERGVDDAAARRMTGFLNLNDAQAEPFLELAKNLFRLFRSKDASLLELNPLVLTSTGGWLAVDAKFVADDNALFRQPEIAAMRDPQQEHPREVEASRAGLNYIQLDGEIGCMVNGAGLAMATMDIIQLKGGRPANFLDVGGGVSVDAVCEAFKLLFSDAHVKAILVNIFGGIVRCDIIASGLLQALKSHSMQAPVIMRLVGTNEEEGRRMIREAGVDVRWAEDLDRAAAMAVSASRERA